MQFIYKFSKIYICSHNFFKIQNLSFFHDQNPFSNFQLINMNKRKSSRERERERERELNNKNNIKRKYVF